LNKYFFQLQLVNISCKLIIIWVSYERKKEVPFYETPCISCMRRIHSSAGNDRNILIVNLSTHQPCGTNFYQNWKTVASANSALRCGSVIVSTR